MHVVVRSFVRLAAVAAGLVLAQGAAHAADAAKGKQNFMKYGCWQCHGTVGQGSPITGPKLAPSPMPLEAMSAFIRNSNRTMPPYREAVLPNEDLADIHAYLSSVPAGPDPNSIDILKN